MASAVLLEDPEARRRASSLHKQLITRLRPLPFQYIWSLWHSKPSNTYALTQLSDNVADIGAFYRIFNNFPWKEVPTKDSVHFFRSGVRPLWEDERNHQGGCWTLKVRKEDEKALRVWEELCLMVCGGELQAELADEHGHVLGISLSPRLYWSHISLWTQESDAKIVDILEKTILSRLSQGLRPTSAAEYYFRKHSDHEGWKDVVKVEP